jgi:hypothetical protein
VRVARKPKRITGDPQTDAALAALDAGRHKYGAKKSRAYGYTWDSLFERRHADDLEVRRLAGEIRSWSRGPRIVLVPAPTARESITYTPDFRVVHPDGRVEYHETKGKVTEVWGIKKRLWRAYGPPEPLIVFYLRPAGRTEIVLRRSSTLELRPTTTTAKRSPRAATPRGVNAATRSASMRAGKLRSRPSTGSPGRVYP